jgi:hypothetical protein
MYKNSLMPCVYKDFPSSINGAEVCSISDAHKSMNIHLNVSGIEQEVVFKTNAI